MGGRIEVNNAPGEEYCLQRLSLSSKELEVGSGAIFRFFIQATKPSDKSPTQEPPMIPQLKAQRPALLAPASPSRLQSPTQSLHVLITEDNKINQVCNGSRLSAIQG